MNTQEIVTREYVYRPSSEAKKNAAAQKSNAKGFKGIWFVLLATALVALAICIISIMNSSVTVVANASTAVANANTTVASAGSVAGAANSIATTEKEIISNPVVATESNVVYRLSKYFETHVDKDGNQIIVIAKEDKTESTSGTESTIIGDGSLIGSLGFVADIFDSYRADDPELPSYLTLSYNRDFCMKLSQDEIEVFCKLVEAEAPAEGIFGKILVANVVLNRVLSNRGFADTVTGVIYQKFGDSVQFSPPYNEAYWNSIVITDETREAVARALAGEDYSEGALFFFSWRNHPEWTATSGWTKLHNYLFKHGGHIFFK